MVVVVVVLVVKVVIIPVIVLSVVVVDSSCVLSVGGSCGCSCSNGSSIGVVVSSFNCGDSGYIGCGCDGVVVSSSSE